MCAHLYSRPKTSNQSHTKSYTPHTPYVHDTTRHDTRRDLSLTRKGKVKPPVESNVRRVSVLARAHKLGVLDGGLGNGGGRCLLTHHAYPIVRPHFLPIRSGLGITLCLEATTLHKWRLEGGGGGGATNHRVKGEIMTPFFGGRVIKRENVEGRQTLS